MKSALLIFTIVALLLGNSRSSSDVDEVIRAQEAILADYLETNDIAEFENAIDKVLAAEEQLDTIMNRAGDIVPTIFNLFITLIRRELNATGDIPAMQCFNNTIDVFVRSRNGPRSGNWAKRWTDSRGRKPSGFLQGAINFIGAPDECVRAHPPKYDEILDKFLYFEPKFCRLTIQFKPNPSEPKALPLPLGVCLPSNCEAENIQVIYKATIDALRIALPTRPWAASLLADNLISSPEELVWLHQFAEALEAEVDGDDDDEKRRFKRQTRGILDILDGIADLLESRLSFSDSLSCMNGELIPLDNIAAWGYLSIIVLIFVNVVSTTFEFIYIAYLARKRKHHDHRDAMMEMKPIGVHVLAATAEKTQHQHRQRPHVAVIDYREKSFLLQVATSFSVIRNFVELFDLDVKFKPLGHIAGIKTVTLLWVILGHGYFFGAYFFNLDNIKIWANDQRSFTNQAVKQSQFGADTMFFLSGFMVAYVSIVKLRKRQTNPWAFWAFFYIRRYIRLTPIIAFCLWQYYSLTPWTFIGITFPKEHDPRCGENWWATILYINNFYNPRAKCLGWSWWFSLDFQFYLIAPFFIIAFLVFPIAGVAMAAGAVAVHAAMNSVIGIEHDISAMHIQQASDLLRTPELLPLAYERIYVMPWTRVGPFGVGLLLAFIVATTNFKARVNKLLAAVLWVLSIATGVAIMYGLFPYQDDYKSMPRELSLTYLAVARIAWAVAVAWPVFACSHGAGGIVNRVLSMRGFQYISKLSFITFVIHPIVQEYWILARERLFHFMVVDMAWLFCGHAVISLSIAVVFYVGVERPFINLFDTAIIGSITKSLRRKN